MTDVMLRRGDTAVFDIPVTRYNPTTGMDEPVLLTVGGTFAWFTAKRHREDSDADAVIQKTSADDLGLTENVIRVILNPEDTEDITGYRYLHYDVQIREPDDTVTTVESGVIELTEDVTRTSEIPA